VKQTKASAGGPPSPRRAGSLVVAAKLVAATERNAARNLARWCRALARTPRAPIPPVAKTTVLAIAVAPIVIVAAMFLVDRAALYWARHLPPGFVAAFEVITNFGLSSWFLVPFGVIVLCFAAVLSPALPRATQGVIGALAARFGYLFLAIAVPGLFATIVKRMIGRARPYLDIHGDPFTYKPFIWRPEYASMPSGHSTTAASAAFAIGAIWPRSRPFMWLYALLIMFSRVVLTAHHPSDVIAGALVGAVGAGLVRRHFAARRLVFSPHDLARLPGPSLHRIAAAMRHAVAGRGPGRQIVSQARPHNDGSID
jgi:membrane-associated phospholipid phosphatase